MKQLIILFLLALPLQAQAKPCPWSEKTPPDAPPKYYESFRQGIDQIEIRLKYRHCQKVNRRGRQVRCKRKFRQMLKDYRRNWGVSYRGWK